MTIKRSICTGLFFCLKTPLYIDIVPICLFLLYQLSKSWQGIKETDLEALWL